MSILTICQSSYRIHGVRHNFTGKAYFFPVCLSIHNPEFSPFYLRIYSELLLLLCYQIISKQLYPKHIIKLLKSRFRKSILFCRIKDSFYSASAVAILKTIIHNTKNREIAPTPIFTFPVNCAIRLITVVPRKEAPFPHMSISPKYSPDFSAGMILVK